MNLTHKYYKIYIRFIKERYPECLRGDVYYHNDYYSIISDSILPHLYDLPHCSRRLYVRAILNEYVKDIVSILNDRLSLVNYDEFIVMSKKFDGKESFIKWIVENGYVHLGLNILDRYLTNRKNVKLNQNSYETVMLVFFGKNN